MKFELLLLFGIVLMVMCFAYACGKDNPSGSREWSCDVTLPLVPSTLGNVSSPSGSGKRCVLPSKPRVHSSISTATRGACARVGRILGWPY